MRNELGCSFRIRKVVHGWQSGRKPIAAVKNISAKTAIKAPNAHK